MQKTYFFLCFRTQKIQICAWSVYILTSLLSILPFVARSVLEGHTMAVRAVDTLITQSFPTGVDSNTQSNGNGGGGAGEEGKFLVASAGNDNMVLDSKTRTDTFIFQEPIKLTSIQILLYLRSYTASLS